MRTLYLLRHAETAWNAERRYQGQTDVPLNETGRKQAAQLRARLLPRTELFSPETSAVLSSDLARARESAEIAFHAEGRQLILDEGLRELRYGIFEGLSRDEIADRHPEAYERFGAERGYVIQGGESRADGRRRALVSISRALDSLLHPHLVVMTHGGILRQLLLHAFADGELPTQVGFANMCVHVVHVERERWTYAGTI